MEDLDARGKKKKMKKKETKMAAAAYAALTDEDWCITQAHECAMLLGESSQATQAAVSKQPVSQSASQEVMCHSCLCR